MNKPFNAFITFHCPRYEELPDLDMYMDQVLQLLNRYFANIIPLTNEKIMTKTMINNYVKNGVLPRPQKKKYTRNHLAYLIVISALKQTFSIDEIATLIQFQMREYPIERAYNYFCEELEACIQGVFTHQPVIHAKANNQDEFEVFLLSNAILAIVEKLYVQACMDEVNDRLAHYIKQGEKQ